MEITRDDIITAIARLRQAGKKMPQADRIRSAADKTAEEKKVMAETVQLWWQLFIPKHVTQEAWGMALNKALLRNDINAQVITPGLMDGCLKELEQERLARAEAHRKEDDDVPFIDPEARRDILTAMAWGLKTMRERGEVIERGGNPIGDFVQDDATIVSNAVKLLGVTEDDAWCQKVLLRCWNNDRLYSLRTGNRAKTSIGFRNDGRMVLCYD